MSMMDPMDDALLGVDDDELDYDLEKDEEDALLADDNYEENYESQGNVTQHQQFEITLQNEEENDILDIDANVALDETEEDYSEQTTKENSEDLRIPVLQEHDEEDEIEEQKERTRFPNERSTSIPPQRLNSHEIPDTLDKVAVQPIHQPQNNNNQRNGRFQRGRGRGRGRPNYNRGSVFGRVGNIAMEGKTVLINPHFRGNVQASENARLVWDSNFQNNNYPQQRYQGPQMAQVAPFQSQPSPWITPPYAEHNNNFNHPPIQQTYHEPPPPLQYNQPTELMNTGIRPLMQVNNQPPPFVAQQPPPQQQQGNFRGRDTRYNNQTSIPPLIASNPPPNYNQQNNFQGRNNFNFTENQPIPTQNRPYPNQPNTSALITIQQNYPPPQQNFDQPAQQFIPPNQFNQTRHVQSVYEYNDQNQFHNPHNQFPAPMHNNQHFQEQNFQQPVNYDPNFAPPNQAAQESFPPKQFNHQYNQNRQNNQHQRHQMNQYNNRTPPKRRSFENTAVSGDRDLPKKKKRSMEFSNLHEVPTVDMPDTTTEEKEEEDEETKEYRLKIEEQKKLREEILRKKEERRRLAAEKIESTDNSSAPTGNVLLTTKLKNKTVVTTNKQQQLQPLIQPKQQWRPQHQQQQQQQQHQQVQVQQQHQQVQQQHQPVQVQQQFQQVQVQQQFQQVQVQQHQIQPQQQLQKVPNIMNRNFQQQKQRQMMQQRKQMVNNQQRSQNIQVQTNAAGQRVNQGRVQQRRNQQQNQQANIVITQKHEVQQRIVMLRQNPNPPKTNLNRRVVLKGMNNVNPEPNSSGQTDQDSQGNANLSSFLSNRKVISKNTVAEASGVGLNQPKLLDTPIVVVSNLAAGTTDVKIRKLCQGLGPLQNIQMIPNQRQATIRFKNIISAHKFFKKYQRKIIDLSMIHVSLEPES